MSLNSIGCVTVQKLTNKCAPVATYFNDFGPVAIPTAPVQLPVYDREAKIRCLPSGVAIWQQNVTLETAPVGAPPVFEYYNMDATPYTGSVSGLMDCGKEKYDTAGGQVYCASGVEYSTYDVLDVSVSPPVVVSTIWKNNLGAIVAAPVGAVLGKCVVSNDVTVTGSALPQIAGSSLSASNPNFAGQPDVVDTGVIAGNLLSVTVTAAGVTNGQSSPNRIEVDMPDGTIAYLLNGETKEFNLSRSQEQSLRREYKIRAIGNAYANIHGTFA